jgi:hypothetical protein
LVLSSRTDARWPSGGIAQARPGRHGKYRYLLEKPLCRTGSCGIHSLVVNARHVKHVPGRKTDIGDAQWLATLTRAGLLRGSFVPPAKLRELRLISRQRQKLVGQLSAEKTVYTNY